MSKVIEVTDKNFEEEVLESEIPTEIDFWAPWCGPCRMVSPIYDKLAGEYEGRFKFCKINVDENPEIARQYQIMSIPMQMFFFDGQKVDEILGAVPENTVKETVNRILQRSPKDDKSKLKLVLASWTESNKKHGEKIKRWTEKAKNVESEPVYQKALQAVKELEKSNEQVSRILTEL
jgi:thioredoxin 1